MFFSCQNRFAAAYSPAGPCGVEAGSGAFAFEALSRGASRVEAIEPGAHALPVLRANAARLGNPAGLVLHARRFEDVLPRLHDVDLVFADPPYADREAANMVLGSWNSDLLAPEAVMVIEQDSRAEPPVVTERARLMRRYDYGDTALFVFGPAPGRPA